MTSAVRPVLALLGPTAAGKSDLAVRVAQRAGGEIVNADSMQLYRGMDIGTAKLTPAERHGVRHHLLDIWDVTEPASVAAYQRLARAAIDDILARDWVPILTGGSGLYARAVLDDLVFPGTDADIRARLEGELAAVGAPALHARLADLDPAAARSILPTNGRRIVRALEVNELTGRGFTARMPTEEPVYPSVRVGLDTADRSVLDARIAERTDRMWAAGLVAETRGLVELGLRQGRTASRALGYQQVLAHLDGTLTEDEARAETTRATRRFARRQRSWFRRDRSIRWVEAAGTDPLEEVLDALDRTIGP